jgi:hypothetical protein
MRVLREKSNELASQGKKRNKFKLDFLTNRRRKRLEEEARPEGA